MVCLQYERLLDEALKPKHKIPYRKILSYKLINPFVHQRLLSYELAKQIIYATYRFS